MVFKNDSKRISIKDNTHKLLEILADAERPVGTKELSQISGVPYNNISRLLLDIKNKVEAVFQIGSDSFICKTLKNGSGYKRGPNTVIKIEYRNF